MPLRRRRSGLPDGWREILDGRSVAWRLLASDERNRLGDLADWLLRDRRWEAARGFELTDEVRAVVAAHAVLPILGLDESWYDGVGSIIVRDGSMTQRHTAGPVRGTLERSPQAVDGESHHDDGPLMVSWRAARREAANPRFGRDVVLHEFAHKIDMHDGVVDGTPLLVDDAQRQNWIEVCTAHYDAIRDGDSTALSRVRRHQSGGILRRGHGDLLHSVGRPRRPASGPLRGVRPLLPPGPGGTDQAYAEQAGLAAVIATTPRIIVRRRP